MKKILASVVLLLGLTAVLAAQDYNCFSIIAGRNATVDGSVLMAHNEDDSGEQMLNIYVVPATDKNLRYIWCEFPGMEVSDVFMNQFGVSVASNGCPSREDKADLKGKGVLYEIRTSVAKYARTAREAVAIIGSMVETFGYSGSGRSYIVADPQEGWVVSVVKGKHWVAQRVPDDQVMTIPNYFVIGHVDLEDEANFAGCEDLVEYALERGWYDPEKDGAFNFAKAYAAEKSLQSVNNITRHKEAWNYLFGEDKPGTFAAVPNKKLSLRDMMNILSLHEEPTPDGHLENSICSDRTVLASIFQLRAWMGFDKGCVMWNAMGHPCSQVFVPWYAGITQAPEGLGRYKSPMEAELKHMSNTKDKRKNYPDHFYWKYVDGWDIEVDPSEKQREIMKERRKLEKENNPDYNAFIRKFY
ncbi:MAG: C69 family dipeptidase [Bacteroidales bacterium]|nr:C69 family dipeptidase [Bacteroidales bacterium]